jgi:hypothetical protein
MCNVLYIAKLLGIGFDDFLWFEATMKEEICQALIMSLS